MASVGSWILSLFGIRTLTQGFVTTSDQPYLEIDPAFATVIEDPANQRNILTGPAGGGQSATSLTLGGVWKQGPVTTATTTATSAASTSANLFTVTIPVGTTIFRFLVIGTIVLTPTVTASASISVYVGYTRPTTGALVQYFANGDTPPTNVLAPFVAFSALTPSGSTVTFSVNLGTLPTWAGSTAYTAGPVGAADIDVVSNDGGKLYMCKTPGTSAGSGGPTGTGADITDGSAHWTYVGTSLTVTWTMFPETRSG